MNCSCGAQTKEHIVVKKKAIAHVYEECKNDRCGRVYKRPSTYYLIGKKVTLE